MLRVVTAGAVLTNQTISLYKTDGVLLSTVKSGQSGHVGFQKVPWIAVAGYIPVWTGQHTTSAHDSGHHELVSHTSLPATAQASNVALLMYRQSTSTLVRLKIGASPVFAHFPFDHFDSSLHVPFLPGSGRLGWVFGAVGTSYVGLGSDYLRVADEGGRRNVVADAETCTWTCVVGTESAFGSFDNFQGLCLACRWGKCNSDVHELIIPAELCRASCDGHQLRSASHDAKVLRCSWNSEETVDGDDEDEDEFDGEDKTEGDACFSRAWERKSAAADEEGDPASGDCHSPLVEPGGRSRGANLSEREEEGREVAGAAAAGGGEGGAEEPNGDFGDSDDESDDGDEALSGLFGGSLGA